MKIRSLCCLTLLAIGMLSSVKSGQDYAAVWILLQEDKSKSINFSAVHSLSVATTSKDNEYLEWLWIGDESGSVMTVHDPNEPYPLNLDKIAVEAVNKSAATPQRHPPPAPVAVNDIYFRDPKNGFLLRGNTIYTTQSGGQRWKPYHAVPPKANAPATLNSLSLSPQGSGKSCIVGAYARANEFTDSLVQCNDNIDKAGVSLWRDAQYLEKHTVLFHLDFADDRHGWIVGAEGTILYTEDGGEKWKAQDSTTQVALFHVDFYDSQRGWVVGENGTILRTSDGGKSWQPSQVPSASNVTLLSVKFVDENNGWAVGHKGTILYSSNGGVTWTAQPSPVKENLYALAIDKKYCWIVGAGGIVLRSELKRRASH